MERLRLLLYNYYARMSVTFAAGSITQDNISFESTYDNIVLSHLVYKCLIKIGVWLWNKLEKLTPEEYATNFAWVFALNILHLELTNLSIAPGSVSKLTKPTEIFGHATQIHHPSSGSNRERIDTSEHYYSL